MLSNFLGKAVDQDSCVGVGIRMFLFDVASDRAHGLGDGCFREFRLAPADDIEPAGATIGAPFVREDERGPDIGTAHQWEMEVLRHNADDRVSFAVQLDSLVQFRFEPLTPQSVTDDSYMSRSELVLAVEEVAAGRRLHAEHAEKVGRDASAFHALRDCAAREVEFVRDLSR